MKRFSIQVNNLRGVRQLSWSPSGVSLLIGANGAGKSTVLLALKLLRAALDRGMPAAVPLVLGSSQGLKHRDAQEEEPVSFGLTLGDLQWTVQLRPRDATVDYLSEETLYDGERPIFVRDALGNFTVGDRRLTPDTRLGLRAVLDAGIDAPEVAQVAAFIRDISVFHDPDLWGLRNDGSDTRQSAHLHSRGSNALTMLRRWQSQRPDRWRYQFVMSGLKAAFPGLIEDLDFEEAGNTLVARVYRPGVELPFPLATEANGVLGMLVNLCCVAAADPGGVVAIDEPENALHPYALRVFFRQAESLARNKQLTVLLSTHSTVLLDQLQSDPGQVYVIRPTDGPSPVALPDLRDPDWLSRFRLGELYADGELGSNDDAR